MAVRCYIIENNRVVKRLGAVTDGRFEYVVKGETVSVLFHPSMEDRAAVERALAAARVLEAMQAADAAEASARRARRALDTVYAVLRRSKL